MMKTCVDAVEGAEQAILRIEEEFPITARIILLLRDRVVELEEMAAEAGLIEPIDYA